MVKRGKTKQKSKKIQGGNSLILSQLSNVGSLGKKTPKVHTQTKKIDITQEQFVEEIEYIAYNIPILENKMDEFLQEKFFSKFSLYEALANSENFNIYEKIYVLTGLADECIENLDLLKKLKEPDNDVINMISQETKKISFIKDIIAKFLVSENSIYLIDNMFYLRYKIFSV